MNFGNKKVEFIKTKISLLQNLNRTFVIQLLLPLFLLIFVFYSIPRQPNLLWLFPLYLLSLLLLIYKPEFILIVIVFFTSTVFTLDVMPQPISIGEVGLYLPELLVILLSGRILICALTKRDFGKISSPLTLPMILFFIWTVYSALKPIVLRDASALKVSLVGRDYIFYINYFLTLYILDTEKKVQLVLKSLLAIGMVCAILSVIQYIVGPNTKVIPLYNWAVGKVTFESDEYSLARVMPTSISLIYMLFFPVFWMMINNKTKRNFWDKIAVVIFSLALFVTFSRNVYYSIMLGFTIIWFIYQGKVKLTFFRNVVSIILIVILVSYIPVYLGVMKVTRWWEQIFLRHQEFLTQGGQTETLAWRTIETQTILGEIASSPILGKGIGVCYYHPLYDDYVAIAHNGYLSLIYQTGLIGLGLMAVIVIVFLRTSIRTYRRCKSLLYKNVILGLVVGFIALLPAVLVKPVFVQEFYWISLLGIIWALPWIFYRLENQQ